MNDTFVWPGPSTTGEVIVAGQVSYEYRSCGPDTSVDLYNSPQYFGAKCSIAWKPARRVLVEVLNDCGHSWAYAGENGHFLLSVPDTCANLTHRVRVHSMTRKLPGLGVAVGGWQGGPITSDTQLTANPADYHTHWAEVATFTPPAGDSVSDVGHVLIPLDSEPNMAWAAHIIDNMLTGFDYFANFVDPADLHPMNVAWSVDGPDFGWNVYKSSLHPAFMYLRPSSTHGFPAVHELSHYIHRFFMDGAEYGRFGEPMANVNAAMILRTPWLSLSPDSVHENLDFNGHHTEDIGGAGGRRLPPV